jgi:hypothetical protein
MGNFSASKMSCGKRKRRSSDSDPRATPTDNIKPNILANAVLNTIRGDDGLLGMLASLNIETLL